MRKQLMQSSVIISAAFGAALTCASPGFAADTHVIGIGDDDFSWTYKDKVSAPNNPIAIDDLKIGDTVEVHITDGHGFVTIKRNAGPPPTATVDKSPVLACGEDASSKPNAVLREQDCGATSNFGVASPPPRNLRLEVMNTFKDPVDFYCVIHKNGMPGVLKLAP
jgi:hypothetical protein